MFLLDTYIHILRFRIDKGAPTKYMNRWKELKHNCENGINEFIVERMRTYCKLEQNKTIPYLRRVEGGIGGDDNKINKQMRFRIVWKELGFQLPKYMDNDIVLNEIISSEKEKWSYEELDDIIYALTKTFNHIVDCECVDGVIEMSNRKCLDDDYLDSDDD